MKSKSEIKIFVIMPFGKNGTKEYRKSSHIYINILKPTLAEFSDFVKRADEFDHLGNINKDIVEYLFYSDIVIADLTGKNANVFYELGIRHSLRKNSTIPIAKVGETIPFDVSTYRTIFYTDDESGLVKLQSELKSKIIMALNQSINHIDNPVYDALETKINDLLSANNLITESRENYQNECERLRGLLSIRNSDNEKLSSKISNLVKDLNRKKHSIAVFESNLNNSKKNTMQSKFLPVEEKYWETNIKKSENSFIVLISGNWVECNNNVEYQLTKISSEYDDHFILIRFNLEKINSLANKLEIKNLPTVLFVDKGNIVNRYDGVQRDEVFRGAFNKIYSKI